MVLVVVSGYPGGFCPIHYGEGITCWHGCWETRLEFARVARELEAFWQTPDGKAHTVIRSEVA